MEATPLPDFIMNYLPLLVILGLWELTWKLIALWKSARKGQLAWFIITALLNTAGILPIIYILMNRNSDEAQNAQG